MGIVTAQTGGSPPSRAAPYLEDHGAPLPASQTQGCQQRRSGQACADHSEITVAAGHRSITISSGLLPESFIGCLEHPREDRHAGIVLVQARAG